MIPRRLIAVLAGLPLVGCINAGPDVFADQGARVVDSVIEMNFDPAAGEVTITEVPVDAIPRVGEGVESPPPRVEDPPRKSVPAGGELGVNKILLNTLSRSSAEGPTCDIAGEWTYEVEAFNNGVGPIVNGWVQVVMVWSGASVCNPDVLNEPEMPAGFGPSQGGWSYSDITNDGHSQSRVWGIDPPAGGGPFKLWAIFSVNE